MPENDDQKNENDEIPEGSEQEQDEGSDDDEKIEGEDKLGDPGKQALARMKDREKAAREALREYKALGLKPAEIKALKEAAAGKDSGKPASEQVDVDQITREAEQRAEAKVLEERIDDKIEAKASGFADPEYAKFLLRKSHSSDDFTDANGKIDAQAITDALNELLEEKPELAAQGGKTPRFQGGADGGTRKGSKPGQLTRADVQKLKAQPGGDAKIVEAKKAGRLNDLLGIK